MGLTFCLILPFYIFGGRTSRMEAGGVSSLLEASTFGKWTEICIERNVLFLFLTLGKRGIKNFHSEVHKMKDIKHEAIEATQEAC